MDHADLEHFYRCRFIGQCWSIYLAPCTPNLRVLTAPSSLRNAEQRWSGNECLVLREGSELLVREGKRVFIPKSRSLLPGQPMPTTQS